MKRLFMASLALIFFLSACGTNTPPTPTPTQAPATEVPPTVAAPTTAVPTNQAITPTATGSAPGNTSGCVDGATFVADVTIPDYAHLDPRQPFTKTWRIKNTGSCTWNTSYMAVYASGDKLGGPNSIAFTETAPGGTMDISADMAAPGTDGQYKIFYQLEDATGKSMTIDAGNTIWAIITVGKVFVFPSPTPLASLSTPHAPSTSGGTGTTNCTTQANAGFIGQTLDLINAARATNGLPALTLNDQLSSAAQLHSADMACSGILSHTGTDGSTPATRIAAAGYSASISRENIYAQPPQYGGNPQAAVDWWMSDQIHRDAILNAQVTQAGIGYAAYAPSPLGGNFTVDFGAP
jgi:uncharacterized protein YkwD